MNQIIIDGKAVYEVDEDCILKNKMKSKQGNNIDRNQHKNEDESKEGYMDVHHKSDKDTRME